MKRESAARRIRIARSLEPVERAPDEFPAALLETDDRLAHLGFRGAGFVRPSGALGAGRVVQSLLLHADRRTLSMIHAAGPNEAAAVVFVGFLGDRAAVTTNRTDPPVGPAAPGAVVFDHPGEADLEALYQAHAAHCVEVFAGAGPDPIVEEEAVARAIGLHAATVQAMLSAGEVEPSEAEEGALRLTEAGRARWVARLREAPRRGVIRRTGISR